MTVTANERGAHTLRHACGSPAQHAENEIHDKEGAEDDHGDEVAELPRVSIGVLDLEGVRKKGEKVDEELERDRVERKLASSQ